MEKITITEAACNYLMNSDDYICVSTPERILKFANQAYCSLFEKTNEELIGTKFTDNFSVEHVVTYNELIKGMTPENQTISATQKSMIHGVPKWISWKQTGVFDDKGNLLELLAVGRDVNDLIETKREKDKQLLNAFRKAIDTNIICTITDVKGVITHANEKFCKVSKYSREELIGKTHNFVNSGYHSPNFFVDMWRTITKGHVWMGEIKNKAKDGTYYWVESVIMPIKDEQDKINGYLSLRILIDEQKKLEEEKNRYMKSLEDMLFTVSHEIRRPITSCQGILNLLQESMPETTADYYEHINYLASSAAELDEYSRKLNDELQKNIKTV